MKEAPTKGALLSVKIYWQPKSLGPPEALNIFGFSLDKRLEIWKLDKQDIIPAPEVVRKSIS